MAYRRTDIMPRIGAEIAMEAPTLLGGVHAPEIRALLEDRGVLVFRATGLTDAEQLRFSATLGQVIEQGADGIFKVTLDPAKNVMAEYLKGTVLWHFDGWSDDVPTRASILTARSVSATGGETEFANTYAAYEGLGDDKQRSIQDLRVVHTMTATLRNVFPDASEDMRAQWRTFPERVHPLVWTHRSGRRSLVLGSSASHVVGMDERDGGVLLDELKAWATRPEFVYRHRWAVGDMVIWDNTGVLHRVESYAQDSGRMMHRTTLVGEEPLR